MAVAVFSPIITSLLNTDPVAMGEVILPAVGLYDGVSTSIATLLALIPFFVSRYFLSGRSDVLELLVALSCGGLVYSILMLFEIRFSPQLAAWIYQSFRPGGFLVELRYGGYRPVVFLHNGLEASFFLSTAVIASIALHRVQIAAKAGFAAISGYLAVVLVLCKSAGALIYGVILGAAVRWFTPKMQLRVAMVLTLIALTYPFARLAGVFPTSVLVGIAGSVNTERAESLEFRFNQEDALLAHARERLMFGWGRYGRNRLIGEYGKDVSVTDGQWIIILGQFGLVGFIAQFGALGLSVLRITRLASRAGRSGEALLLSALCLIVAAATVEQLPNASISSWTWLLAGALAGRADELQRRAANFKARHISGETRTISKVGAAP